jgi:hypothetical protein
MKNLWKIVRKTGFSLIFLSLLPTALRAVDSSTTGLWSTPGTWAGNAVPTASDPVNILHTVTVDGPSATALSLNIKSGAELTFSTFTTSELEITGGNMTVETNGHLTMGTAALPVDGNVTATLTLAKSAGTTYRRLIIQNNAIFTAHGSVKTPFTLATQDASSTSVVVPAADAAGWNVGDRIVLGKTRRNGVEESETVTLTGISVNGAEATLSWTGNLTYPHTMDGPLVVANLSRNVVIRSSGTTLGTDTAYIDNQTGAIDEFSAHYALFQNLGHPAVPAGAILVDTSRRVTVSSCAFSGGYRPIDQSYAGASLINRNVFHRWTSAAVNLNFDGAGGYQVADNAFLGGVTAFSTSNSQHALVRGNYVMGTTGSGISLGGSLNFASSNTVVGGASDGISMGGTDNIASGNTVSRNNGDGIQQNTDGAWVFANTLRENGGLGLHVTSFNSVYGANRIHGNPGGGVRLEFGAVNNLSVEDWIGYDGSGSASTNSGACGGMCISNGTTGSMVMRNVRMHPTNGISPTALNTAGNYFLSFKHDQTPGAVKLWGDHTVASGQTLQLDNAVALYGSSATSPRNVTDAVSTLLVNQTSTAAVTQMITVTFETDNLWHIRGTASNDDLTFPTITGGTVDFPAGTSQANISLTSPARQYGDTFAFVLMAGSGDAGTTKNLGLGSAAGGASRISVAAGGAMTLRGTSGNPVVVDQVFVTDPRHTIISSGTFTAEHVSFLRLDASGLQLSGTGGVQLATVTFSNGAAGGTYVTARNLTSSGTFHGMTFNAGAANNVRATGTDSGLAWTLSGSAGALSGQAYESDANQRIRWTDAVKPATTALTPAADDSVHGRINLAWTAPGNDGNALNLAPGAFRIFYSTLAADRDAAAPAQAQVLIATTASPGSTHGTTLNGLLTGSLYYFRFWSLDETPNASDPFDAQSLAGHPDPAAPAAVAVPSSDRITVAWAAPANVPGAYMDHYELTVSTGNDIGPYSPLNLSIAKTEASLQHTGLLPETAYYYRLVAADAGGKKSPPTQVTATTPDQSPPETVTVIAANTGDNAGEVQLDWSSPGDNQGIKDLPIGSRYYIQHAAGAGISWSTASAQVSIATGPVTRGTVQSATLSNLPAGMRYFTLWTLDNGGNLSAPSTPVFASVRENAPSATLVPFGPASAPASLLTRTIGISFSKTMDTGSTSAAFSLTRVKDNMGNAVSEAVPGAHAWDGTTSLLTFTPGAVLQGNSLYEIRVEASASDPQGNTLPAPFTSRFRTLLNPSQPNLWEHEDGRARVVVPAGALSQESGLTLTPGDGPVAQAASQKLVENAGDPLRRPISGSLVDLKAADAAGALLADAFATPVTVSLPYEDDDDDGFVDGSHPPVKVKTLNVFWLNEEKGAWVKLPTSRVDPAAKTVSAETPHFTVFALAGRADAELADAHPFPNPADASIPGTVMTFTNIGQVSTVKIFTRGGRLVRTLRTDDGSGAVDWDMTNDDGEPVAAGLYLYEISSGPNKTTGKAAVLR